MYCYVAVLWETGCCLAQSDVSGRTAEVGQKRITQTWIRQTCWWKVKIQFRLRESSLLQLEDILTCTCRLMNWQLISFCYPYLCSRSGRRHLTDVEFITSAKTISPIDHSLTEEKFLCIQSWSILCQFLPVCSEAIWCVCEVEQESPAIAEKPARRESLPKLLQFDVPTTLSLTILAYLHAFNCYCVRNPRNPEKSTDNSNLWSSRSSKVIDLGANRKPICDLLLVINSNFSCICYRFRDIHG